MTCLNLSVSWSCTLAREVEGKVSWWRPMETECARAESCWVRWPSRAAERESGSREGWVRLFERGRRAGRVGVPWRCESKLKVEAA